MLADSYKGAKVIERFTKDDKFYAHIQMRCDRCGGQGYYAVAVRNNQPVLSPLDGGVCWKCGGVGHIEDTVRDYTEAEYERLQRAKAKRAETAEVKRAERETARIKEENKRMLNSHGFNEVYAYAVTGDTYSIKEELKAHGAKFSYELLWICPEEPTWLPSDRYVKIAATDVFDFNGTMLSLKENANAFIQSLQPKRGEYLGEVGQRVTVKATVVNYNTRYSEYCRGWSGISYVYTLKTPEGNIARWSTNTVEWDVGHECTIVGTIKELTEYNGVRQTVLTRCKEVI